MADFDEIVYVKVDEYDHHGLYINHELFISGDHIWLADLLDGRTARFTFRDNNDADKNWLDNVGHLPESLDELYENEDMWDEDHHD